MVPRCTRWENLGLDASRFNDTVVLSAGEPTHQVIKMKGVKQMPYLQYPQPIDRFCHRCGARLNHYGVCPNQAKHLEDDTRRHNDYESKKEKERQYFDAILSSVFDGKPIPSLFSEPHKHVWESYGDDKQCCKLCGIIAFNKDLQAGNQL